MMTKFNLDQFNLEEKLPITLTVVSIMAWTGIAFFLHHIKLPQILSEKIQSGETYKGKNIKSYYNYFLLKSANVIITNILSVFILIQEGITFDQATSPLVKLYLYMNLGYFISDSMLITLEKIWDRPVFLHHVISIMACIFVLYYDAVANELHFIIMSATFPAIFRMRKEFLELHQKEQNTEHQVMVYLQIVSFFIARFVIVPIYIYHFYNSSEKSYFLRLLLSLHCLLSCIWGFNHANFLMKKISQTKKSPQILRTQMANLYNFCLKVRTNKGSQIALHLYFIVISLSFNFVLVP